MIFRLPDASPAARRAAVRPPGTAANTLGNGWSVVDGLYDAAATLTTSSVLDPKLTITDSWLKLFTAGYALI